MFADLDAVTGADILGMVENMVVDQRAVGGAEILDHPSVVASKMRAWTLETRASSITTAQSEARPMVVSAWSSNTWPATAGGVSTTSREPASLSSSTGAAGGGEPLVAGMAAGAGTATRFSVRSRPRPPAAPERR